MSRSSRFFVRLVVGFVVSFFGMAIATGSLADAAAFMLMSIICTAGISLVVWVPVWWGVGWIVMAIIGMVRGKGTDDFVRSESNRQPIMNKEHVVADFITKARTCGLDNAEIRRRLIDAGWTDEAIADASKLADQWITKPAT